MIERLRRLRRSHPRATAMLRWATSLALLALALAFIDVDEIAAPLASADGRWLAAALLVSVPQLAVTAWRWSFTARRMGVDISPLTAWREYYVSALLNLVLPGGVVGDVVRVARHADRAEHGALGPVARSVVVERAVGQLVLWLVVLGTAAWWGIGDLLVAVLTTLLVGVIGVVAVDRMSVHPRFAATAFGRGFARLRHELRAALLDSGALAVQLLASLAAIVLLIAMFYCCAAAIGSAMTPTQALLIVPWILAATTLPLTVGGWGIRELSAMALFPLASIPAAEGAAAAVLFGAISLVSALPGLVPLALRRRAR